MRSPSSRFSAVIGSAIFATITPRVGMTLLLVCVLGGKGFSQIPANAALPAPAHPTCHPGDPITLDGWAYCAASLIAKNRDASEISEYFDALMLLAIADGLQSEAQNDASKLKLLVNVQGETKRTDKQLGATARSHGSTTLAEKTGIENLLGLAIENGAVQQEVNATTMTLSTSPYALTTLSGGDTATAYLHHGNDLGRIGLSATFNLSNQQDVLSNATRKQLAQWSGRIRLTRDHSTRSQTFEKFWNDNIVKKISQPAVVITLAEAQTFSRIESLRRKVEENFYATLSNPGVATTTASGYIQDYLDAHKNVAEDDLVNGLHDEILNRLREDVSTKVGALGLDPDTKTKIVTVVMPALADARVQAQKAIDTLQEEINRLESLGTATFEYTNVRDSTSGTYSALKLLYEKGTSATMKLVFNIGGALYSNPNRMLNQQTVRDYSTALSWEGNAGRTPFALQAADQSQVTFSFSGSYERLLENRHIVGKKADIASAQGKIEIPVFTGVSLPLSITYSNANEMASKDHVTFNFGFNFDTDKVYRLLQYNKQKQGMTP